MPIAIEVHYTTVGKSRKKIRNVIGVICPTALYQSIDLGNAKPIYVDLGDAQVDWQETSAGFEMLLMNLSSSVKLSRAG